MTLPSQPREIVPAEIQQRGLYIPRPEEMSEEQLAAFEGISQLLVRSSLHGFNIDPSGGNEVSPYDPETHDALGLVSYEEVISYFKPTGLVTTSQTRDYATAWKVLRGTSARIAVDLEKWQAYFPLSIKKERLETDSKETLQQYWAVPKGDLTTEKVLSDKMAEINKEIRELKKQIRQITGQRQRLYDPSNKPFIYVTSGEEPRPLRPEENKRDPATYVPNELTSLNLDNLHANASRFNRLGTSPNMRVNTMLTQLLNSRIAEVVKTS